MRVQLIKGWIWNGIKLPIGKIIPASNSLGADLIKKKIAKEYNGEYPPKSKMKTNFFKQ
jgi:hypothetical protein